MKLLVQPGDGIELLLKGINSAKRSVEIVIFRFDRREIEKAITKAAGRGVFVHALIAYTNRGGEKNLRKLELRLLAEGVTVARTADAAPTDRRRIRIAGLDKTRLGSVQQCPATTGE